MKISFEPIGYVRTDAETVPRHWTVSDVKGFLDIKQEFTPGLKDIKTGDQIVVLFHFHKSPPFTPDMLTQIPPHRDREFGVFSICSPRRPNALGLSVVRVDAVHNNIIEVTGIDMLDGTPIIDIKPHILCREECPSHPKR